MGKGGTVILPDWLSQQFVIGFGSGTLSGESLGWVGDSGVLPGFGVRGFN